MTLIPCLIVRSRVWHGFEYLVVEKGRMGTVNLSQSERVDTSRLTVKGGGR